MNVADTTVAVGAALRWHTHHTVARNALGTEKTRLLAHVAVETYSVLTRLPPAKRVPASLARAFLDSNFEFPVLALSPALYASLLDEAVEKRISGGAVYDALVAATARQAGATLLTLDRRAESTYRLLGVDYRFVA